MGVASARVAQSSYAITGAAVYGRASHSKWMCMAGNTLLDVLFLILHSVLVWILAVMVVAHVAGVIVEYIFANCV